MDRREANRIATRKHIQQSLLDLLSDGKQMHQISTAQICEASGIARSTLYLHFQDKYAIIESIIEETRAGFWDVCAACGSQSMSDLISGKPTPFNLALVKYLSANKPILKVLLGPSFSPDLLYTRREEIETPFIALLRSLHKGQKHEQLLASQFFSGIVGLYRFYLFENTQYSDEQMAVIFGNMLRSVLMLADHL